MPAPHSYERPWHQRVWEALKPPPVGAHDGTRDIAKARTQRRVVLGGLGVATLAAAGWLVYTYVTTAAQRAEAKYQEGTRLMATGAYEEAIARFDLAISVAPTHAHAYVERGAAKRFLNRLDDALADLNRAAELNPALTKAYVVRGGIFRDRGDTQRAINEFTRSIQVKPTIDALYERAQTYESLGDHYKAIGDFDQAIAIMREAPYIYRARGLAKRNLGDEAGYRADHEMAKEFEH